MMRRQEDQSLPRLRSRPPLTGRNEGLGNITIGRVRARRGPCGHRPDGTGDGWRSPRTDRPAGWGDDLHPAGVLLHARRRLVADDGSRRLAGRGSARLPGDRGVGRPVAAGTATDGRSQRPDSPGLESDPGRDQMFHRQPGRDRCLRGGLADRRRRHGAAGQQCRPVQPGLLPADRVAVPDVRPGNRSVRRAAVVLPADRRIADPGGERPAGAWWFGVGPHRIGRRADPDGALPGRHRQPQWNGDRRRHCRLGRPAAACQKP